MLPSKTLSLEPRSSKMARHLKTIARWINENRPELQAAMGTGTYTPERRTPGKRYVNWRGKTRQGACLRVTFRNSGMPLVEHNSVEPDRRNSEVEDWLACYLVTAHCPDCGLPPTETYGRYGSFSVCTCDG